MLSDRIDQLVRENGNFIKIYPMDGGYGQVIAVYRQLLNFESDHVIDHTIEIRRDLEGENREDAILHEKVHIYLRELNYNYEDLMNSKVWILSDHLENQLVNLFDHWILVKIISSHQNSNDLFIQQLELLNERAYENSSDLNICLCNALALFDQYINIPDSVEIAKIESPITRKFFSILCSLKDVLVFTDDIRDIESDDFRLRYLEQIEKFLNLLGEQIK